MTRYDRDTVKSIQTRRLHQEDFCQALGFTSAQKYTADGGPTLTNCFALVRKSAIRPGREVLKLLDAVIFNIIIGNADAHSKNFSLLYTDNGITLAPLYDLLSTISYPELSPKFAMRIAKRAMLEELQPKDIQTLANDTGLTAPFIRRRIAELGEAATLQAPNVAQGFELSKPAREFMDQTTALVIARAQQLVEISRN